VIEVETSTGRGYLQLTHVDPQYGHLLRALPGTYRDEPPPLSDLVELDDAFVAFFPLDAALSRGLVHVVGNETVPKKSRPFPRFLMQGIVAPGSKAQNWWLWDGKKEVRLGELRPEHQKLPVLEIVNDAVLRERLERGWRTGEPET
jgi:hypothetical protein